MEANGIIKRSVYDATPVTVEYELTASGYDFRSVLEAMALWGMRHREAFMEGQ